MSDSTLLCHACGSPLSGRAKKWCSEACRLRKYREDNPNYVLRQAEMAKEDTARRTAERNAADPLPRCECCGEELANRRKGVKFCKRTAECRRASRMVSLSRSPVCSVEDCGRQSIARGLCGSHASAAWRAANPERRGDAWHAYRARKMDAFVEDVSRGVVLDRDNWVCHICGDKIPKDSVWPASDYGTMDHVVPLKKGGQHSYANVKAAHNLCNSTKRDSCEEVMEGASST